MNKQEKRKNGEVIGRGIEWTDYSWNPIAGCKHACRWKMPDGKIAICYAEEVANGVARASYPAGFEHHYWNPQRLNEPLRVKEPSRIFLDSMSDLMGSWVPDDQINQVLDVCRKAHWHTFQLLTKNAPRLLKFDFPANVWVGVSSPPDFMFGKEIPIRAKNQMLAKSLSILSQIDNVTWLSAEPLSWDITPIIKKYPKALDWVVIGAASAGKKKYQPNRAHVQNLLDLLDAWQVPIFFKGNLKWDPHREDFPSSDVRYCRNCGQYLTGINDNGQFCSNECWREWDEIPF